MNKRDRYKRSKSKNNVVEVKPDVVPGAVLVVPGADVVEEPVSESRNPIARVAAGKNRDTRENVLAKLKVLAGEIDKLKPQSDEWKQVLAVIQSLHRKLKVLK